MTRDCGECAICCRLIGVAALDKPAGVWCQHARPGLGCGIHGSHPAVCQAYRCGWLTLPDLPDSWRPDRCGFMLRSEAGGLRLVVEVEPERPDAWRAQPFYGQIKDWSALVRHSERHVVVAIGGRLTAVFPETELDLGPSAAGDVLVVGYQIEGLMRRPAARLTRANGEVIEVAGEASMTL